MAPFSSQNFFKFKSIIILFSTVEKIENRHYGLRLDLKSYDQNETKMGFIVIQKNR